MAQNINDLPEGTDTVIDGAARSDSSTLGDTGNDTLVTDPEVTLTDTSGTSATATGNWGEKLRSSREEWTGQASERANGLIGQGLERSSEALANVSRMIGDTATGIDERLGQEYGDYARRAAEAIENAASSLAAKQPEELIEDTRNFVRKSPGVALAGAAVIGFALTRLVKNGLSSSNDDEDDRTPPRTTSAD